MKPSRLKHVSLSDLSFEDLHEAVLTSRFTPIFVTGPYKRLNIYVRAYLTNYLPLNREVEWVDFEHDPEPIDTIRRFISRIRQSGTRKRLFVILDEVNELEPEEFQEICSRLFNWKAVESVIAITSGMVQPGFERATVIFLDFPFGELYQLENLLVIPQKEIISIVRPQIIGFNDSLIKELKRSPKDLFKITPRQFEEVIAELLSGMGLQVELTPETRDGGKDILAYMDTPVGKLLTLVEAKQHKKTRPVGVSLVRSLFGTLVDHQATNGMLVTTSRFAKPATEFQERHKYQLSLKDYGDIVSWLLKYRS